MTTTNNQPKNNKAWHKLDEQMRTAWARWHKQSKTWEQSLRSAKWYKAAQNMQEDVGRTMEKVRDEALHRVGLVTHSDLDALQRKLAALDKRINDN